MSGTSDLKVREVASAADLRVAQGVRGTPSARVAVTTDVAADCTVQLVDRGSADLFVEIIEGSLGPVPSDSVTELRLPGGAGNYVSTPDPIGSALTAIDLRWVGALDDWSPAADAGFVTKWKVSGNQRAFLWRLEPSGAPRLFLSVNGTAAVNVTCSATVGFVNGSKRGMRVTWRASDGRVQFFTSNDDGQTWTQLGANGTLAIAGIFDSTAAIEVGGFDSGTGSLMVGDVDSVEVRNGIDGDVLAGPDFTDQTPGAASFADVQGNVWTMQGTAALRVAA